MADRAKKKERQRLKRKEKQVAHRKAASANPFARIAKTGGEVRCWWNLSYPRTRQAQIMVLREMPGGSHAMAAFLVDLGVIGLKDAWARLDISPREFHERVIAPAEAQIGIEPVDPDEARDLIAGAIRFAHDNGFRLPRRYERCLAILGGVGDWRNADVSEFSMQFAGSMKELHQRLIGQPVDEFLARKDVTFVIRGDVDTSTMLSDEDIKIGEGVEETASRVSEGVRNWCRSSGETPSDLLEDAWKIQISAHEDAAHDPSINPRAYDSNARIASLARINLEKMLSLETPERRAGMELARKQIEDFAASFSSAADFHRFVKGEARLKMMK